MNGKGLGRWTNGYRSADLVQSLKKYLDPYKGLQDFEKVMDASCSEVGCSSMDMSIDRY